MCYLAAQLDPSIYGSCFSKLRLGRAFLSSGHTKPPTHAAVMVASVDAVRASIANREYEDSGWSTGVILLFVYVV